MEYIRKIPNFEEVESEYNITKDMKEKRKLRIKAIQEILNGNDLRKVLIIGPCSADRMDSVLEYVVRLAKLEEEVRDKFVIIPRVYTAKPRTNGKGYKGLVHRPEAASIEDDLLSGILATRKMHIRVIEESGLFSADELLYPDIYGFVDDLLVYAAVGARSVEDQQHRLIASGIDVPVGMKNPTSGNLSTMINSIIAAQCAQRFLFRGWEVKSNGNFYAHAILRGYSDLQGNDFANYYYEDICKLHDMLYKSNVLNPSVIIDCNHSNSGKKYEEQVRIAENVIDSCKRNRSIDKFVKGLMIESYLVDGKQMIGEGIYGCSITDPCLGWEKTEKLIKELAMIV